MILGVRPRWAANVPPDLKLLGIATVLAAIRLMPGIVVVSCVGVLIDRTLQQSSY
jgi:hypothetical protein